MTLVQRSIALAVSILGLSTAYTSSRYYKSAAFERPFHSSILTLFFAGLALIVYARYLLASEPSFAPLSPSKRSSNVSFRNYGSSKMPIALLLFAADALKSWIRNPSSSRNFAILLSCLVSRTVLYWRTIRTIHCSWDGLHTFLPLVLAVYDNLDLQPFNLPKHAYETRVRSTTATPFTRYAIVALVWGLAATDTLLLSERTTGAICPAGWCIERMIPLAQLVTVALDALLITQIGQLRRSSEEGQARIWQLLGTLFCTSAAVLAFAAVWSSVDPINHRWNVSLGGLVVRDLIVDGMAVAIGMVSGVYLLGLLHPTTVGLLTVATSLFVCLEWRIADGTMIQVWSNWWGLAIGIAVFLGAGALFQLDHSTTPPIQSLGESNVARNRYGLCAIVAFVLVFGQAVAMGREQASVTPGTIIANARGESNSWIAMASKSTSLDAAVLEYRQRYGMPPPPNFDRWYKFAMSVNSPIIDTFDQINSDLLPYWGALPAILRQRTTHLLEHPLHGMGGLIIEGGKVDVSPHVPGTHRWMLDVTRSMIEPFAQWLPDMQLAFNLDDECRISVPLDDMKAYTEDGLKARMRLGAKQELLPFSETQSPPWAKEYLGMGEEIWAHESPLISWWSKNLIFYEWVSTTCPADAPVNKYHWWNRKTECSECSSPHMTDGFVSNWTLSGDLCHQPDLAYLHGFLLSPAALGASHTLLPVFSQSRIPNFADILYPSPWGFGDKATYDEGKSVPWEEKLNSVFWRGGSSDGLAAHGAWQTFLRARFVSMAAKARAYSRVDSLFRFVSPSRAATSSRSDTSTSSISTPRDTAPSENQIAINVSFVGDFRRCHDGDCEAEHRTFYGSSDAIPPPPIDFQESWRHRHLVDLDGAAFSGRFLPFLKSSSLPYRAALFRTWWEERVHAWRHFVPLDVRLGELWRTVGFFGGSGSAEGKEIAQAGREWAEKALRKEDMQVYMFRLLLEWGRLVDDRREDIGFS